MLKLIQTKKNNSSLIERMQNHYSKPNGFVGRSLCYAILFNEIYYGHIVGGSATRFLPGRNEFFKITIKDINSIINNVFYNIQKVKGEYPKRNFTISVLDEFTKRAKEDWEKIYLDNVIGFESLVEKPRTGELYLRAGWSMVGETKGFSCKRVAGKSGEKWGGKRVWNTEKDQLKPKLVFCKKTL